ncbi:hypothetical protein TIFTF001_034807 [Ficus carica]|uniref:Protein DETOXIFICATION n=1 Tax=Ficus carica TaxID=3494 RepID=A0AA88E0E9_FICCA|nr:hypothetical protein TIFTF001_034779 [Ficus carica]GMN65720.1 hypothetical protein TIFTF001_034786 [Ficus carica]GMN65733.1 hypothetical protein TIFTF001_034800 [Ficus carica]GMN65741.1 hypothetical protein TIFTF001_034807 [Ficus carica]
MEMEENHKQSNLSVQVCEENRLNNESQRNHGQGTKRKEILVEVKKQLWLAGPLVVVSVLQYCLRMISIMFVGRLGELSLSGASMATSFASVTGFSLLLGMASALETLCGQSYGAKQYHLLGIHMQRAMFVLLIVSIPLAVIWANTEPILRAIGQDADIAAESGRYARFMIPSIFAYGVLQCLVKFLQTQNIVFPMVACSGIVTLLHIFWCWVLVFKSGLGSRGAALAISISYWTNVLLFALYVKFSSSCAKSRTGLSKEAFKNIPSFLRLAIPSAIMICLETWSFETMVLLSGLLPNPKLETSVLSIILNTASIVWMIPFGLSGAVSIRVSNELGAWRPKAARLAVFVVVAMAITEGILVGSVLVLIRNVWGYAYSNDIEVVKYVAIMLPILAASNFVDGLQCVLSGCLRHEPGSNAHSMPGPESKSALWCLVYPNDIVGNARGCGWQKIGAYVNLGSYYLVGIPSAVVFAFVLHIGAKAQKAAERECDSRAPVDAIS